MVSRLLRPTAAKLFSALSVNSRPLAIRCSNHHNISYSNTYDSSPRTCSASSINGLQIRFQSTNAAEPTETPQSNHSETTPTIDTQVLKWEDVPKEVAMSVVDPIKPVVTGAILPFSQLYYIQLLFFPYTYSVMYFMDFLLNYMPWWAAIVGTTATARLIFFPVVLHLNKQGIKTFNILPQSQKIQMQLNEATLHGDAYNQAIAKTKLNLLNKEHGLTLKSRLMPIFIQAPMYASIFLLLRGLTSIPAEGLATGGALWFTNLTIPDPYYVLPIVTSGSLFLLLEFGLEGGVNPTGMGPIGRYVMRAMPVGMFFFIQSFPAATLLFWSTSNLFTLGYALLLKNSWVKKELNIPARLVHKPEDLPLAQMSFKGQMRKAIDQGKGRKTTFELRRLDDISFRKAGVGPLRKTYQTKDG